jgi:hypothetical protein
MEEKRCAWMSGPKDSSADVPAARWWLAISRNKLVDDYSRAGRERPPATCHLTPAFISPLTTHRSG